MRGLSGQRCSTGGGGGGGAEGTGPRAQDRGQVDVGERRQEGAQDSHMPKTTKKTLCQPPGAYSDTCNAHNHACIADILSLSR